MVTATQAPPPPVVNGRCTFCVETYGETGQPAHFGSAPACAFPDGGLFSTDNWNCALMGILRGVAETHAATARLDDDSAVLLPVGGGFVQEPHRHLIPEDQDAPPFWMIAWYKRRGRTEGAWFVTTRATRPMDYVSAWYLATYWRTRLKPQ